MLGEFIRTAREYAQVITSGSLTKVDRLKLTADVAQRERARVELGGLGPGEARRRWVPVGHATGFWWN